MGAPCASLHGSAEIPVSQTSDREYTSCTLRRTAIATLVGARQPVADQLATPLACEQPCRSDLGRLHVSNALRWTSEMTLFNINLA